MSEVLGVSQRAAPACRDGTSRFRRVFEDVWRYLPLDPVPSLAAAFVGSVAAIYAAVVHSRVARAVAVTLLVASTLVVLYLTARGAVSNADGGFNWRLGESIRAELTNINRSLGVVNVLGNVVLFMPIGWLVAVLTARRPILLGSLSALALSTAVEVWQMASGSFGDVGDILLNSMGGLTGAVAATLLRWLTSRQTA